MLLKCARGVAARANAHDMCGARKKQTGRQKDQGFCKSVVTPLPIMTLQKPCQKDRREDAIRIERVYNGRGCGRASALTRARSEIEGHIRMSKVNLEIKLSQFSEHWAPRTVAQFNGHDIMVVKSKGEFVW